MAAVTFSQTLPDRKRRAHDETALGSADRATPQGSIALRYADQLRVEADIMRRDIADKDSQIIHLNKQIETLGQIAPDMSLFLTDLERATGETFLTDADDAPSPLELAFLVKKGVTRLLALHQELPDRYEHHFMGRAESALSELERKQRQIEEIRTNRTAIEREVARLGRLATLERQEKQSLEMIEGSLTRRKADSAKQREATEGEVVEAVAVVEESKAELQKTVKTKEEKKSKFETQIAMRPPKRVTDAANEGAVLNEKIADLRVRLERETQERLLAEEELQHVHKEIDRAQAMINKFKANLTKAQQGTADSINNRLREDIEQQREDFRRAIANQRRRNIELEKQRAELIEEEKLLAAFLQTLEKQLQAQLHKLPSLAELQHRTDGGGGTRKSTLAKGKRAPDDPEMRGVKKQIAQMRARKGVSKSVLAGSRYH
jgi:hypothetical protein